MLFSGNKFTIVNFKQVLRLKPLEDQANREKIEFNKSYVQMI